MENLVGKEIEARGLKYKITGFKKIGTEYPNIIKACENSGKYPAYFFAGKILRNGNVSEKQTIVCLFFKETESFIVM